MLSEMPVLSGPSYPFGEDMDMEAMVDTEVMEDTAILDTSGAK